MHSKNRPFFFLVFFLAIFSSSLNAACTPAGTAGDDIVTCSGTINTFQYFYGGSDTVTLNNVSDITYGNAYWLDEALGGNPATDGDDTFIAYDSRFTWVLGFGGDDSFEIYDSVFRNVYADTNPGHGVSQRGNDEIYIEDSVSSGWILGGNDNDTITIKNSRVSFVAAGYSDILSDIPGYIDYTPFDGNDTIILDNVDFGEPNYYYTTRPGAVEAGKADDTIIFRNGGSAYGVTAGHGDDRIVVEDDMLFNACTFTNDRGNEVKCGIYGDEPYASEPNATTIARHGNDEIIIHAGDLSGITVDGGDGSDVVIFYTPVVLLDTNVSGGDDRSIADGFADRLVFDGWDGELNGSQLQNWETIVFDNVSEISFLDNTLSSGYEPGTDPLSNFPYGLVLQDDSSLNMIHDFTVDSNVYNRAIVNLQADGNQPATTLTVVNNYHGNNGLLAIDTVLNDASSSVSDKLIVEGDTSGTTKIEINNVDGTGGETPTGDNEGILVVEVYGNSDPNAFVLAFPPPHAGEYEYRLLQGSNGNWYLQSYKTPPVYTVIALPVSLTVESYSIHKGALPQPLAGATCPGPYEWVLDEDAKHGDVSIDSNTGEYTYTPDADYRGADSFSYQVLSDQCTPSNTAMVTIAVDCTTSQASDSGDAFSFMSFLLMILLTGSIGVYFIRKKSFYCPEKV